MTVRDAVGLSGGGLVVVEGDHDGAHGVIVTCEQAGTHMFVPEDTLVGMNSAALERVAHAGRNVEHITRVTGYFSKVKSWNKGKVAELADRMRTPL